MDCRCFAYSWGCNFMEVFSFSKKDNFLNSRIFYLYHISCRDWIILPLECYIPQFPCWRSRLWTEVCFHKLLWSRWPGQERSWPQRRAAVALWIAVVPPSCPCHGCHGYCPQQSTDKCCKEVKMSVNTVVGYRITNLNIYYIHISFISPKKWRWKLRRRSIRKKIFLFHGP